LGSFEKFVGFSASGFSLIGPLSRRIRKKISAAKNVRLADLCEPNLPDSPLCRARQSRLLLDKSLRTRTTLEPRKKSPCKCGVGDAFFSQ
jgi:hypothetical protein